MVVVCEYCKNEFSTASNLGHHQKHARYCLALRTTNQSSSFSCSYCDRQFSTKYNLTTHLKSCSEKKTHKIKSQLKEKKTQINECNNEIKDLKFVIKKLKDENLKLKDKVSELEGTITGLKTAPDKRIIYNTNTAYVHPKLVNLPINNVPALTQEFVEQKVNDGILTYSLAARGYSGMLEVICELITHENDEGIVERNYVCTDVSRNSFHRLLESKEWKSDKGGRYLNSMLDTFQSIMEEYKDRVYNMYSEISHDSPQWRQVDWERKNISKLYGGVVCREGTGDREDLVNALRKDISKRAYV